MNQNKVTEIVERVLENLRPYLQADGGDIKLISVSPEWVVSLKLLGACRNCDRNLLTLRGGVEENLRKALPKIKSVKLIED